MKGWGSGCGSLSCAGTGQGHSLFQLETGRGDGEGNGSGCGHEFQGGFGDGEGLREFDEGIGEDMYNLTSCESTRYGLYVSGSHRTAGKDCYVFTIEYNKVKKIQFDGRDEGFWLSHDDAEMALCVCMLNDENFCNAPF